MRSVMEHQFSRIPKAEIQRSSFDRSAGYKTTFDSGYLIPIFQEEVLPGDTFNCRMTGFCRLATPLHPYMDNAYMTTQFFFVPLRLIWDNWVKMMGEQRAPGDSTDYLTPELVAPATGGFATHSIADYLGMPTGVANLRVSAFWHRAYNLIYNEWYRDENLQNPVVLHTGDGPDPATDYALKRRGKRHDYFTSSLPWPQKGESVSIPLGSTAPIGASGPAPTFRLPGSNDITNITATTGSQTAVWGAQAPQAGVVFWSDPGLYANLEGATAATINQLRQAFQIQKLYERDARGGTRYTELIRSHFGVTSPDARLQRPEYLGGGTSAVNLHTVPQTQSSPVDPQEHTPQGNLAAYGTAVMSGHGFTKGFTEHGVILGLLSVRADLTYQRGLHRMYTRRGRFDYYWPALAHIGEQAVLSKEIYCDGTAADDTVWGYQERFAEYRYKPSLVTGKMRSTDPQSLDTWHLSQDFATRPNLNSAFIEENPPFPRVIAVTGEPEFIGDFHFNMRCARPMPVYGVPGMMDHF